MALLNEALIDRKLVTDLLQNKTQKQDTGRRPGRLELLQ